MFEMKDGTVYLLLVCSYIYIRVVIGSAAEDVKVQKRRTLLQ